LLKRRCNLGDFIVHAGAEIFVQRHAAGLNAKPMIGPQELGPTSKKVHYRKSLSARVAAPHIHSPHAAILPLTLHNTLTPLTTATMTKGRVCLAYSGTVIFASLCNVTKPHTWLDSLYSQHSLT
jgi:hypothetical protein